jgi:hypothetical protein
VLLERGADSDIFDPAGNQVEHAGRSQVNVIRSSNSGIDRIAFDGRWEGEGFLLFPLLPVLEFESVGFWAGDRADDVQSAST